MFNDLLNCIKTQKRNPSIIRLNRDYTKASAKKVPIFNFVFYINKNLLKNGNADNLTKKQ